jgi:hypothetical protein
MIKVIHPHSWLQDEWEVYIPENTDKNNSNGFKAAHRNERKRVRSNPALYYNHKK